MKEWKKKFDEEYSHRRTTFNDDFRNSWGYVRDKKYSNGTSTHCFAGMHYQGSGITHILNGLHFTPIDKEIVTSYYHWLLNSSPYAPIFISRDAEKVIEEAVEVIDAANPANLIVGGMTASRTASEYPYILVVWDALVKQGVHPNVAFCYAHVFRCKKKDPDSIGIIPAAWNHAAISGDCNDAYVENFIHAKMASPEGLYSEIGSYGSVQSLWHSSGGKHKLRAKLASWFDSLPSFGGGSNNPFAPKKSAQLSVDHDIYKWERIRNIVDTKAVEFNTGIKLIGEYLREGYKGEFN